jgi:serine protease inhibitor
MNGNAKIETEEVLGFPQDIQKLVWSDTVTQIVATYDGKCIGQEADDCLRRPLVEIENSIWIDNEDTLNVAYEGIVGDYLKYIDFQSEIAGNQVNEWVKEKTHGLIDSLVLPGPLSPLILLPVNTIYVKGNWKSEFSPRQTNQDVFYTNAKRNAKVKDNAHFMHKLGYYSYPGDSLPGYQVLKLPFTKDSLSMILVLPTSDSPNLVAWTKIIEALPDLESTRLAIAIPKFRLESEYTDDLKTSLVGIGLEKPFLEGLCVFEDDCSAFISQIIQKTAIQMDEKGVEAAAATAIMIATSSQYEPDPILFLADHPFQYIIFDEVTDSVLFEGVSGNPEPPEEATAPLGGKHSDSNFWTANFGVNPKSWSDEKPNILAWLLSALSAIFSSLCAFTAIFA